MDDRALIEGLLAQSDAAWIEFDRQIKAKLLRMFTSKGVVQQDQLDCYHHFYVHLIEDDGRRLRQWRGESTLVTWLCSVARNFAVDWVWQVDKHQGHHVQPWEDDTVDGKADPALVADPPNPETAAIANELTARLRRAIEDLPPQERRVAELLFRDGRSSAEIAAIVGITANNVYQIRHRVQQKLRDVLNPSAARPRGGGVT